MPKRSPFSAEAIRILLARAGQTEITWVARRPEMLDDLRTFLLELFTPLGVPLDETARFSGAGGTARKGASILLIRMIPSYGTLLRSVVPNILVPVHTRA